MRACPLGVSLSVLYVESDDNALGKTYLLLEGTKPSIYRLATFAVARMRVNLDSSQTIRNKLFLDEVCCFVMQFFIFLGLPTFRVNGGANELLCLDNYPMLNHRAVWRLSIHVVPEQRSLRLD